MFDYYRETLFLGIGNILPRLKLSDKIRPRLYRLAGMSIGDSTTIWGPLTIRPIGSAENITIGANVFINTETRFGVPNSPVTIGDNVMIGPRVMFETVDHSLTPNDRMKRASSSKSIKVEENAWLGAGVILTPGVTVGRNSVVAAGAVVVNDIPENCLAGGVPAKIIRHLQNEEDKS